MNELEIVKQELEKHHGKGNEISAGVIEEKLGYARDDTHAKGRRLIKSCAKKYNIPLAGNTNGYYIIENEAELNEYRANLQSRRDKINERENIMVKNYEEWHKK